MFGILMVATEPEAASRRWILPSLREAVRSARAVVGCPLERLVMVVADAILNYCSQSILCFGVEIGTRDIYWMKGEGFRIGNALQSSAC